MSKNRTLTINGDEFLAKMEKLKSQPTPEMLNFLFGLSKKPNGWMLATVQESAEVNAKVGLIPKPMMAILDRINECVQKIFDGCPVRISGYAIKVKGLTMISFALEQRMHGFTLTAKTEPYPFMYTEVNYESCRNEEDVERVRVQEILNDVFRHHCELERYVQENYAGILGLSQAQLEFDFEGFMEQDVEVGEVEIAMGSINDGMTISREAIERVIEDNARFAMSQEGINEAGDEDLSF